MRNIYAKIFGGGLDQSFSSLDAQRESCEAFIQSQRQEGCAFLQLNTTSFGG
jgi:hypothetical protein